MTNTSKKMTKKDYFFMLLNIADVQENEDLMNFINHEIELLNKKNSSEKKPTAKQIENSEICTAILEGMEDGKLYTITDLIKTIPCCAELSNQRVSALVRQMLGASLERVEEKRKAYFRKITE